MNWVLWTTFHQSDGHILYCDNKNRWIKVWFGRMKIIWHEQVIFTLTAVTHVQYSTHYGTVTLGIEWIVWLMLMNQAMVPCTALPKQLVWADKQNSDPQQTSNWQKNITSLDAITENDKGWASLILAPTGTQGVKMSSVCASAWGWVYHRDIASLCSWPILIGGTWNFFPGLLTYVLTWGSWQIWIGGKIR